MNHKNYLDEIAPAAARRNGQNWDELNPVSRQIILDTVRETAPGGGQTALEKACGQAIADWYEAQRETTEAETVAEPAPEPESETPRKKTTKSKKE